MKTVTPPPPESLVLGQLKASAEQLRQAKEARILAIRIGRAAGITWARIGAQLGISDASCIQLIQRADKDKDLCHTNPLPPGGYCASCGLVNPREA